MITNTRRSAVALLATAGLLAGCGDSDNKQDAKATTGAAASANATTAGADAAAGGTSPKVPTAKERKLLDSPNGQWATNVCNGLAKNALELQPPNVDPTHASATKTSLVTFFEQVTEQLGGQAKVLKSAGNPPAGQDAYDRALKRLAKTEKTVAKLGRSVKASDADSPQKISAVVADLGKKMASLGAYGGPVVDLSKDKQLKKVLRAESACAQFMPPEQTK